MSEQFGIAYIISNKEDDRDRQFFEDLCNKSIKYARSALSLPVILLSFASRSVNADIHVDASEYIGKHDLSGLGIAELLKTYICDWSPFSRTLYLDCDAFVLNNKAIDYLDVLNYGYELSVATCASMNWKDHIACTSVKPRIFEGVPRYFPYWNFGVFGCKKSSTKIMETIRRLAENGGPLLGANGKNGFINGNGSVNFGVGAKRGKAEDAKSSACTDGLKIKTFNAL